MEAGNGSGLCRPATACHASLARVATTSRWRRWRSATMAKRCGPPWKHRSGRTEPCPLPGKTGGAVRITAYDMPQQPRQLAYVPDALPTGLCRCRALNGISELLADGPDHLLVLERFAPPLHFGRVSTASAPARTRSDTLNQPQLTPGNHQPLKNASAGPGRRRPALCGQHRGHELGAASMAAALLLVSDNNFNPAEVTQFVALRQEAVAPQVYSACRGLMCRPPLQTESPNHEPDEHLANRFSSHCLHRRRQYGQRHHRRADPPGCSGQQHHGGRAF